MKMKLAGAALIAASLVLPATARSSGKEAPCRSTTAPDACAHAPDTAVRPEADVRSVVENFLRYRVERVERKGGCYTVLAADRSGAAYAVTFRGSDLRMVSRYPVKEAQ